MYDSVTIGASRETTLADNEEGLSWTEGDEGEEGEEGGDIDERMRDDEIDHMMME